MKKKYKKRFLLLMLFAVIAILFWNAENIERWIYPIKYQAQIEQSARNHNISPLLVAAVIRAESNYKPHLVSKKGAVGLMQLMPETAEWAAGKMGIEPPGPAQLYEPQLNIEIGSWYLQSLYEQFEGNQTVMIAAYNAGPTNVRRWLNERIWDGQLGTTEQIPFGETRHYVQRVYRYLDKYEKLYGTSSSAKEKETGSPAIASNPIPTHLSKN